MVSNDVITSPLQDYFVTLGYNYDQSNGKSVIRYFSSPESEINSLYNGVGLVDLSANGILELNGKDVLDFLHRITTNSLKDLPKEGISKTIFTTEKGKIIDTATIMNFDNYQILFCSRANKFKVKNWIEKYVISDDVKITDVPGKYILFQLIGPQADSFITLICGNYVNNMQADKFRVVNCDGMMFFTAKFIDQKGNPLYWVLADVTNGQKLTSYLNDTRGPFDFNFIGEDAWNSYRIEQGIPVAPFEINDQYNPHEVNLLDRVSFTKGCYIGQEVIARLDTYDKVQKQLFGVIFPEPIAENEQFQLFDEEGKEAGSITSSAYSYKLNKYIGLGIIRKLYLQEGFQLKARNASKNMTVSLTPLPFKK
ncbi:MAG: glycine cleavage T C-terminal barrel domain-containing protein [Ignavibacteriaceae bacterium]|nr:glycine cleavage T C-terminal barrel domain-containing protein [Ignavibacteriaceae bacterium]